MLSLCVKHRNARLFQNMEEKIAALSKNVCFYQNMNTERKEMDCLFRSKENFLG